MRVQPFAIAALAAAAFAAPASTVPADTGHDPVPIVPGTGATVSVGDDEQLRSAIAAAGPGDTIVLSAGTYGPVTLTGSGTAEAPITLTAAAGAVIDGGSGNGYALHLDGAAFWQVTGVTIAGGGKGVVLDRSQHVLLDALDVGGTRDEAVHFRAGSSDNVIQRSVIHDTGLGKPQFGEGVYLGSAQSNWAKISGGAPDLSMRNRVLANTFERIAAENVDVKEETGGSVIAGNHFDGSAVSGQNYADSIIDVKGHDTVVVDNVTTGSSPHLGNIVETHVITDPATSGCGNTIEGNTVEGFTPTGQLVAVDKKCL